MCPAHALVGGSDQQVTQRVRGLFHNRYVGRCVHRELVGVDLDPGAPPIASGLELKGARTLRVRRAQVATKIGTEPEETVTMEEDHTRCVE